MHPRILHVITLHPENSNNPRDSVPVSHKADVTPCPANHDHGSVSVSTTTSNFLPRNPVQCCVQAHRHILFKASLGGFLHTPHFHSAMLRPTDYVFPNPLPDHRRNSARTSRTPFFQMENTPSGALVLFQLTPVTARHPW